MILDVQVPLGLLVSLEPPAPKARKVTKVVKDPVGPPDSLVLKARLAIVDFPDFQVLLALQEREDNVDPL